MYCEVQKLAREREEIYIYIYRGILNFPDLFCREIQGMHSDIRRDVWRCMVFGGSGLRYKVEAKGTSNIPKP